MLVAEGIDLVIAIPRHRLGDEIALDLDAMGISACVYRGRDADDPEAPGETMCRELERAGLINEALGSVSPRACKHGERQCRWYEVCGYQRQRRQRPKVWVVPQQLLFRQRPSFIPAPGALAIDESFYPASLHGLQKPERLWLMALHQLRFVPRDVIGTADLHAISMAVHAALMRCDAGHIRRAAIAAMVNVDDLRLALGLEWKRKIEITEIYPDMPIREVAKICRRVANHNQLVRRLAQFWELLHAHPGGDGRVVTLAGVSARRRDAIRGRAGAGGPHGMAR